MPNPETIFTAIIIVAVVIAVLAIVLTGYVKAPPDQAYIISGLKKAKCSLAGPVSVSPSSSGWISCTWAR